MQTENPQYLPSLDLSREEMEEMQWKIAGDAVFQDRHSFGDELTVAGVDQAFLDGKAVSGVVVLRDGEVVEKTGGSADLSIPYIPGLLAFREGECIVDALEKLESSPDLLILDGSGRIHFRQAGIATHIGVMFDAPAIGVAKNLLCGEPQRGVDALEQGERVPVTSDSSVENAEGEVIGYAFQSRQFDSGKINPVYVSPGHRVSNETAVDLVEQLCDGYKLPEPTRLADKYVDEVKQSF